MRKEKMLTDQEKIDLRKAICDGVFNNAIPTQGPNGPTMQRGPITPDTLASVAGKTDDEIRAVLLIWRGQKREALQKQQAFVAQQAANLQAQLASLGE